MSRFNTVNTLDTHLVFYSDRSISAQIDTQLPIESAFNMVHSKIRSITGGTSFRAAFQETLQVLTRETQRPNNRIGRVEIIFFTDGEDSTVHAAQRILLVNELKASIAKVWQKELTIHSIGFTAYHDFNFLDQLRQAGSKVGGYRYAEPKEDNDSLSSKINSVLEVVSTSATSSSLQLVQCPFPIISIGSQPNTWWLNLTQADLSVQEHKLELQSLNQDALTITATFAEDENDKHVFQQWYTHSLDKIAGELIEINKVVTVPSQTTDLHLQLLENRIKSILVRLESNDELNSKRLAQLMNAIRQLKQGTAVNMQSLSDIKDEGKYETKSMGSNMGQAGQVGSKPLTRNAASWCLSRRPNRRGRSSSGSKTRLDWSKVPRCRPWIQRK